MGFFKIYIDFCAVLDLNCRVQISKTAEYFELILKFRLCKEQIQAEAKALGETANSSKDSPKVQNLEKIVVEKSRLKDEKLAEYKIELENLPKLFPEVESELKILLGKLQQMETLRMAYVKAMLLGYMKSVDMTKNSELLNTSDNICKAIDQAQFSKEIK